MTQREACPNCGMRTEDFFDAEGQPHEPPLYEPVVKRCEGCASRTIRRNHLERDVKSEHGGLDGSPEAMKQLAVNEKIATGLAGTFITILPFDPYRS